MVTSTNDEINGPCLYSCNSEITAANREFIELSGFTMEELLGRSLEDIGDMLKINSQILFDNINNFCSGFIFTKSLEVREVDISLSHNKKTNEKIFTFVEKLNPSFKDKLVFVDQLFKDNIQGAAIFSVPDLILLKANQKFMDTYNSPFHTIENSIGKTIKEFITGFEGSQTEVIWNSILENGKTNYMKEYAREDYTRGTTYWDVTQTPIYENGIIKYIFEVNSEVTEKVLEIKQAENRLKERELHLRLATEAAGIGTYVYDFVTRETNWSPEISSLWGIENPENMLISEEVLFFGIHPEDRLKFLIAMMEANEPCSEGTFVLDYRIICSDGSTRWLHIHGQTEFMYEGQNRRPLRAAGAVIDITERKQMEEKLETQKMQLEEILDNIHEEIHIVDDKGNYIYINESAKKRTFHSKFKKVYDGFNRFKYYDLSGNRLSKADMPITKLMNGESLKDKTMIVYDPNKRFICTNVKPLFDKDGTLRVGIVCSRDVTNDILYKQSMERQLEMVNNIVDNIELPVMRLSYPDLTIIDINQRALKLLKAAKPKIESMDDFIGGYLSEDNIKSKDIDDTLSYFSEEIIKNKCIYFKQIRFNLEDEEMFVNILCQPIFGEGGQVVEILSIVFDVTSEIKANNNMQKTLKMQEEFFANISHELKTPLNVIYSTAQLLNMYCENASLDEKKTAIVKYINSIKQNSHRLSKLINNIVDSSKIEAGFFELNLSNHNIVEVVEEIVMSVTSFIEIKGLSIIFDTDTEEKVMACDPEMIERVILNLISNAVKFSDIGNEIFVSITDCNEFVEISVKDNGIGLDSSDLEKIFDRFKQADRSLSRNAEGTGIGLSLVKSIVELHGGNIRVESKLGEGSKFIVHLPARKVMQENMMLGNKMRNRCESIQVEFSDVYS